MAADTTAILKRFLDGLEEIADKARKEIKDQGHVASGKLLKSIEVKITDADLDHLVGVILSEDYGLEVDTGIPASRVPTSGSAARAWVDGLRKWAKFVKPSATDIEIKRFAFRVHRAHIRYGVPTPGSFKFSKNGRRTSWIQEGIGKHVEKFEEDFKLGASIEEVFDAIIRQVANAA